MIKKTFFIICCLFFSISFCYAQSEENPDTYNSYLNVLKKEAQFRGFDEVFLDSIFPNLVYYQISIDKDKKQPEFTKSFKSYYEGLVNDERIKNGKKMAKQYKALGQLAQSKTGVSSKILFAFWGVETNYGHLMGTFDILSTTATMAYDGRREDFFKTEFFTALKIIKEGHIPRADFKGSWAGAFGNFQFMPTTFYAYKNSFNEKSSVDIINDKSDSFASAGNYLKKMGWEKDEKWGRLVIVPKDALKEDIIDSYQPLIFFKNLGIKTIDNKTLPISSDMKGKLILPSGASGPAFLVYPNFEKILKWNRSNFYALSVVLLADQIEGKKIVLKFPDERRFNIDEIEEVQEVLYDLKFYQGKTDGVVGSGMKRAIKDYQKANGKLIDGYLSNELYEELIKL